MSETVNYPSPLEAYNALSEEIQLLLDTWIKENIRPAIRICPDSSYWFKHVVERHIGRYVSSIQLTGAMVKAGYLPVEGYARPWKFRITFIGQE